MDQVQIICFPGVTEVEWSTGGDAKVQANIVYTKALSLEYKYCQVVKKKKSITPSLHYFPPISPEIMDYNLI